MHVLAVNCGSSSLKARLTAPVTQGGPQDTIAEALVDRIGGTPSLNLRSTGSERQQRIDVEGHDGAMRAVQAAMGADGLPPPDLVGHRVVHGGDLFHRPVLIDDGVIEAIHGLSDLAPLHNVPALQAIGAAREVLGPSVPMVATFDTLFYVDLPARAHTYPIPEGLARKHRIRRYGFHGLAHRYMTERYLETSGSDRASTKMVTLQLGNGCSITASEDGRPIDTSMGMTPLEGLMMGTRTGDIDPSLPGYVAGREGSDLATVEEILNRRSGLLGVSGTSRDMRDLLQARDKGDARAALAVDMFCYRVRKYVGAYLAALGGADVIVFGGGIGENSAEVRSRVCESMEWCGVILDEERNLQAIGVESTISSEESRLEVHVIPVDEQQVIVADALACLASA